jgi:hypothetical protein
MFPSASEKQDWKIALSKPLTDASTSVLGDDIGSQDGILYKQVGELTL